MRRTPAPASAVPQSDISIAGDPLALPHLLPPVRHRPSTVADFSALARRIAADRGRWEPLVRHGAAGRYARLETTPGYQVRLLGWLPGQAAGRHGHGCCGILTVLHGRLTERAGGARRPRGDAVRVLTPAEQFFFAPGYVHDLVNETLEPAVSLHLYFPGPTRTRPHPASAAAPGARVSVP